MLYRGSEPGQSETLESLIAFLETKDSSQRYQVFNPGKCLLGEWLGDAQRSRALGDSMSGNPMFRYIAFYPEPTYGAALERARSYGMNGRKLSGKAG